MDVNGEVTVIVCKLRDGQKLRHGARLMPCKRCNRIVQVGPAGQEQLRDRPGSWIVCTECGLEFSKKVDAEAAAGHELEVRILEGPDMIKAKQEGWLTEAANELIDWGERHKQ